MQAKQLMDSRRFCQLMDDLALTWKKRASTDEDKAWRLQAVLDHLGEQGGSTATTAPTKSLSEVMAGLVDEFKDEAPARGFPPPTEDERFTPLMAELAPTLAKMIPNGKGERMALVPLDVDMTALTGWLDKHKEIPFFVDLDHTINISPERGDRQGWIVPFKQRAV